jgi:hypothetical protein
MSWVFLGGRGIDYQIIQKVKNPLAFKIGEQFVNNPAQPLGAYANRHLVKFIKPKGRAKGGDPPARRG